MWSILISALQKRKWHTYFHVGYQSADVGKDVGKLFHVGPDEAWIETIIFDHYIDVIGYGDDIYRLEDSLIVEPQNIAAIAKSVEGHGAITTSLTYNRLFHLVPSNNTKNPNDNNKYKIMKPTQANPTLHTRNSFHLNHSFVINI